MSERSSFEHPPVGVIINRHPHSPNLLLFDFSIDTESWTHGCTSEECSLLHCHFYAILRYHQSIIPEGFRNAETVLCTESEWMKRRERTEDTEFFNMKVFSDLANSGNKWMEMDDRQAVIDEFFPLFFFSFLSSCMCILLAVFCWLLYSYSQLYCHIVHEWTQYLSLRWVCRGVRGEYGAGFWFESSYCVGRFIKDHQLSGLLPRLMSVLRLLSILRLHFPVAWLSAPHAVWWKATQVEKEDPDMEIKCYTHLHLSSCSQSQWSNTCIPIMWRQNMCECECVLGKNCKCMASELQNWLQYNITIYNSLDTCVL